MRLCPFRKVFIVYRVLWNYRALNQEQVQLMQAQNVASRHKLIKKHCTHTI